VLSCGRRGTNGVSVPMAAIRVLDVGARLRELPAVLSSRSVLIRDGVEIADVACRHREGRGDAGEETPGHAIVFVRRGCFTRSVNGVEVLLDPTVAYCMNPGEEQRYDHPDGRGDDCTAFLLTPSLAASVWGGELQLSPRPLPISPGIDLEHRMLLAAACRGGDPGELVERAIALTARVLELADPRRVAAGRPATARARSALVDSAREALAANPNRSLSELAAQLFVSPHHLSRIFRSVTGETISRHRMRLRTRNALERLAGGEQDLARVAADAGFADQSHLCRVVRRQTGHTPSALRQALVHS
jgi:AraC-like DNA-binding protein